MASWGCRNQIILCSPYLECHPPMKQITMFKGVVQLSGFVSSQAAINKAV
jgi:hypothetical protein